MTNEDMTQYSPQVLFSTGAIMSALDGVKQRLWDEVSELWSSREDFERDFHEAAKLATEKVKK
jgi:hypothetical protein